MLYLEPMRSDSPFFLVYPLLLSLVLFLDDRKCSAPTEEPDQSFTVGDLMVQLRNGSHTVQALM